MAIDVAALLQSMIDNYQATLDILGSQETEVSTALDGIHDQQAELTAAIADLNTAIAAL